MCNDSRELKTAHSRSLSLVFSRLRSGSCCPALCLVSRSERSHEFRFLYRMAAFCEQGSSSCCGRLSGKQNTQILQASPLRHRLLVCTQTQAEEASFISDLVGSHLVLVRSAETATASTTGNKPKLSPRKTLVIMVLAWMLW